MSGKPLIEEEKIEETIRKISRGSFTVLDFVEIFKGLYPNDWGLLLERFGLFGSKRRYTATTYLSNRLDVYSQRPHSLLIKFTRYREDKFKDHRKTTDEERKVFGSPRIAIYRKKPEA